MRTRTTTAAIAIAIAVIALTTGGAVAATLITSKQIKDGTIQSRDVNAAFRASIVNRVPTLVTKTVETSGTNPAASVLCPAGSVAVGGGYRIGGWDSPGSVLVPTWNGLQTSNGIAVGWRIQFHSSQSQELVIGVQVLCQKR